MDLSRFPGWILEEKPVPEQCVGCAYAHDTNRLRCQCCSRFYKDKFCPIGGDPDA